ncbi:ornithine carbamoyltransferase [Candidatus Marinamargulisbacteria bacterium SCGC AAA071-K20]|nr:ornithine carbamoyltransferase [Candidatus Marinamargulisbacteria bacterium SCGC AAA071-K20]
MKHFLDIKNTSKEDLIKLLNLAQTLKEEVKSGQQRDDLQGKTLGLLFQKPSTRTRVSFEIGMGQLGGRVITLQKDEVGLGKREPVKDVARVLSRYVDIIMIRTFDHTDIEEFSDFASIPVINGLTDFSHPCQAIADFLTILENFKSLDGIKIAYLGDGNNVCRSLVELAQKLGVEIVVSTPDGFELDYDGTYKQVKDPREAIKGADVVYTDTWISMGEEGKSIEIFTPYQVNSELMKLASTRAIFMHCLPAHRGEEVTDEVMESEASKIFDQAENRMHAQKAIIKTLLS